MASGRGNGKRDGVWRRVRIDRADRTDQRQTDGKKKVEKRPGEMVSEREAQKREDTTWR